MTMPQSQLQAPVGVGNETETESVSEEPLAKRSKLDANAGVDPNDNPVSLPLTQMHSSVEVEPEPSEILLELGLLITEGRIPNASTKGFEEGPHCLRHLQKKQRNHVCNSFNHLCIREESYRKHVDLLWRNNVPLCIEVLLCSDCPCGRDKAGTSEISPLSDPSMLLLEQWTITTFPKRLGPPNHNLSLPLLPAQPGPSASCSAASSPSSSSVLLEELEEEEPVIPASISSASASSSVGSVLASASASAFPGPMAGPLGPGSANGRTILHAVRSFLHFSQLSAWLATSQGENPKSVMYRVTIPGENFASKFGQDMGPQDHEFPMVQFKNHVMKISVKSLPRLGSVPPVSCPNHFCAPRSQAKRSQSPPIGELITGRGRGEGIPSPQFQYPRGVPPSIMRSSLVISGGFGGILSNVNISGAGRGGMRNMPPVAGNNRVKQRQRREQRNERMLEYMNFLAANRANRTPSPPSCTATATSETPEQTQSFEASSSSSSSSSTFSQRERADFLDSASDSSEACTPTSISPCPSPEPQGPSVSSNDEDGKLCSGGKRPIPTLSEKIDFLKSLDSAASRLFHRKTGLPLTSSPAPLRKGQDRFDFDSSLLSRRLRRSHPPRFSEATRALLGPFEESVLNGRINPCSTVQGFTAEIGASGSFCPRHVHLPVTVFFYTFCDNDKISTPYLAHVDLGEQGYCVPRKGTVQVTLFNPLRTVIKMFVVQFNLENMPNNSQTFLRQRTYFMPLGESDNSPSAQKWLRYLIHLRFASNSQGQIFLHTDIRLIIFRKSDADTATGFDVQTPHELRSFTYAPSNPQFSPRFEPNGSKEAVPVPVEKTTAKEKEKERVKKRSASRKLTFDQSEEQLIRKKAELFRSIQIQQEQEQGEFCREFDTPEGDVDPEEVDVDGNEDLAEVQVAEVEVGREIEIGVL